VITQVEANGLFEFNYSPKQWRAIADTLRLLPRVLHTTHGNPWFPFLWVADDVRRGLAAAALPDAARSHSKTAKSYRRLAQLAGELAEGIRVMNDEEVPLFTVLGELRGTTKGVEAAVRMLSVWEFLAGAMHSNYYSSPFRSPAKTKLVREYYFWLIGAWSALGGSLTYTRNPVSNEITGRLIGYLRATAEPVLHGQALRPSSLKHVIEAAKKLQPIAPVSTRPRQSDEAGKLNEIYEGGPVIVTYVHMRGRPNFRRPKIASGD